MAVYVQEYNPWKEQLAVNLLGGLFNKWQETNQNRKTNNFRGALAQAISGQSGGNEGISLVPQNEPDGYNANPWASAFHKNDNPMTQFNIGTAGMQRRLPTIADIARAGADLGASSRFSGMNPDTVQKIIGEMSQSAEAQRMTDLRRDYAQRLGQAGSWDDWFKILTQGNVEGVTSADALKYGADYSQHRQPHKIGGVYDAGGYGQAYSLDPLTGNITTQQRFPHTVKPDTLLDNQTKIDVARIAAEPQYHQANALMINNRIEGLNNAIKAEQDALEQAQSAFDAMTFKSEEERANAYERLIAPHVKNIEYYRAQLQTTLMSGGVGIASAGQAGNSPAGGNSQSLNSGKTNSNNVWFAMMGSPKGSFISGKFGDDRGDHTHGGIDIPMKEGTEIRTRPEMGDSFTITQCYRSKSFGNTVVFKSNKTIGGKPVRFRVAHLKDGSINHLKIGQTINAGDLIGNVGNTGRSTGSHLHLEIYIGDNMQKVDPATFFEKYSWDAPNSDTNSQNAQIMPPISGKNEQNNPPSQSTDNQKNIQEQYHFDDWGTDEAVLWKIDSQGKTHKLTDSEIRAVAAKKGMTYEEVYQDALKQGYTNDSRYNYQRGIDLSQALTAPPPSGNLGMSSSDKKPKTNDNDVYMPIFHTTMAETPDLRFTPHSPRNTQTHPLHIQSNQDPTMSLSDFARGLFSDWQKWMTPSTDTPAGFDPALWRSISDDVNFIQSLSNPAYPEAAEPSQISNEFQQLRDFYSNPTPYADWAGNSAFTPYSVRENFSLNGRDFPPLPGNTWTIADFINYMKPFMQPYLESGALQGNGIMPMRLYNNFLDRILNSY